MTTRPNFFALAVAVAVLGACDRRAAGDEARSDAMVGNAAPAPAAVNPAAMPKDVAPAAGPLSVFTSLDVARCKLIERNDEEAGYARHLCAGTAGYRVEVTESDLRQDVALIRPDGRIDKLALNALTASGGFSSLGKTAEWRGLDPARPRTLTVRFGVNEDPDPKVAPRSYLVVIRLASPGCVVARVSPGPQQSAQARAIADAASLPRCIGE